MAEAFRELGLEPVDMPMDAELLRSHPPRRRRSRGTSRASATWSPMAGGARGGRSLVFNGHIDVVSSQPEPPLADAAVPPRAATATGCTGAAPAT